MKKTLGAILVAAMFSGNLANGQSLLIREVSPFNEFVTFYVSSVDVSTGATDVQLFEYELAATPPTAYPVRVKVVFEVLINSIPLGLDYNTPFLRVEAALDTLWGPVRISNTDLNINVDHLYYSGGIRVGDPVKFRVDEIRHIFEEDSGFNPDDLQSLIIQTGRLPDGTYRFTLAVTPEALPGGAPGPWTGDELDKTIISTHPITLELISPGGPLAEVQNQTVMTTYPFFQWQSDPCPICSYRIRVARFIPDEHSSAEDAIEDQTVLPLEQAAGFHEVGNNTSFQYPQSGAVDLEPGNIYVWQVQKSIPTTEGDEYINSFIYAFMIEEQQAGYDPIREAVRTVLGDERYEQLFSVGGELMGFVGDEEGISISGDFNIGGVELEAGNIDINALLQIARLIEQGEISVIESEVQ